MPRRSSGSRRAERGDGKADRGPHPAQDRDHGTPPTYWSPPGWRVIYDLKIDGGCIRLGGAHSGRITSQEPWPAVAPPARGERPRTARAGSRHRDLGIIAVGAREQHRRSVAAKAAAGGKPLWTSHHRF